MDRRTSEPPSHRLGRLPLDIEHEFLVATGPAQIFGIAMGRRGAAFEAAVEQHLAHLRESLIPLAERCGRVMREALAVLEALRDRPSEAVERSRPPSISFRFDAAGSDERTRAPGAVADVAEQEWLRRSHRQCLSQGATIVLRSMPAQPSAKEPNAWRRRNVARHRGTNPG
jgi:hypothetical protein